MKKILWVIVFYPLSYLGMIAVLFVSLGIEVFLQFQNIVVFFLPKDSPQYKAIRRRQKRHREAMQRARELRRMDDMR